DTLQARTTVHVRLALHALTASRIAEERRALGVGLAAAARLVLANGLRRLAVRIGYALDTRVRRVVTRRRRILARVRILRRALDALTCFRPLERARIRTRVSAVVDGAVAARGRHHDAVANRDLRDARLRVVRPHL